MKKKKKIKNVIRVATVMIQIMRLIPFKVTNIVTETEASILTSLIGQVIKSLICLLEAVNHSVK